MRDLVGYALYSLIALVGLVLVFSAFSDAETDSQVEQINSELMTYVIEMRKAHRSHPDRYGTTVIPATTLIASGIAPSITVTGTTLTNAFGGTIAVEGDSNNSFTVTYADIPQEVCIQSVARFRPDDDVLGIRVAATATAVGAATQYDFPVSLTTATAACATEENALEIEAR